MAGSSGSFGAGPAGRSAEPSSRAGAGSSAPPPGQAVGPPPAEATRDDGGFDRRKVALIASGGLGVVVLLFAVVFLVAALGGSSPAERAVESFHASAKAGKCDEMMNMVQLPPADELPRPKEKLAELLCDNVNQNADKVPDSISTKVVKENESSATVQAFGSVKEKEWSETYELTRKNSEWKIRWGSEDS